MPPSQSASPQKTLAQTCFLHQRICQRCVLHLLFFWRQFLLLKIRHEQRVEIFPSLVCFSQFVVSHENRSVAQPLLPQLL